jgi:hypothetical protein
MLGRKIIASILLLASMLVGGAAQAAPCRTGGPYDKWLADFEREAIAIKAMAVKAMAIKAMQLKYGLPADSYSTPELLPA